MKFLNGYKTVISSVIMIAVNSDWIAGLITDPDLYTLIQSIAGILFGVSAIHRINKQLKSNNS